MKKTILLIQLGFTLLRISLLLGQARDLDSEADKTPQAEVTIVEISDRVLVPDCTRFGINIGEDTYYSGAALILINLDASTARPVAVKFMGAVAPGSARSWLLLADSIAASNEFEVGEPPGGVRIEEQKMDGFASGKRLILPPFSMRCISWQVE